MILEVIVFCIWYNTGPSQQEYIMGYKKRQQIHAKQLKKRQKRRVKMAKAGQKPDEIFYSGYNVLERKS